MLRFGRRVVISAGDTTNISDSGVFNLALCPFYSDLNLPFHRRPHFTGVSLRPLEYLDSINSLPLDRLKDANAGYLVSTVVFFKALRK